MSSEPDYRKEYDEKIVELAKAGKFFEEISEELDVTSRTLRNWRDMFPSFRVAYEKSKDIIINKMIRTMIDNATNRNYNPRVHEFLIDQMLRQARYSNVRIEGISEGDFAAKVDKVLKALQEEKIRADEAQSLMLTLQTAQNIKETRAALDKLDKIEEKK
jgi:cobalamin biosynthesis Co2+ chelatase CbiK